MRSGTRSTGTSRKTFFCRPARWLLDAALEEQHDKDAFMATRVLAGLIVASLVLPPQRLLLRQQGGER